MPLAKEMQTSKKPAYRYLISYWPTVHHQARSPWTGGLCFALNEDYVKILRLSFPFLTAISREICTNLCFFANDTPVQMRHKILQYDIRYLFC